MYPQVGLRAARNEAHRAIYRDRVIYLHEENLLQVSASRYSSRGYLDAHTGFSFHLRLLQIRESKKQPEETVFVRTLIFISKLYHLRHQLMAPILSNLHTKENSYPSLYDHSIDYSLGFEPAECSYIEISPDPNGTSTIREGFLHPDQVEEWLFSGHLVPSSPNGQHAQAAQQDILEGRLRLLLSTSKTSTADKTVVMPWSQTTFKQICQKFSAPQHIIDILTHSIPHVAHSPVESSFRGKDAISSDGTLSSHHQVPMN